VDTENGDFIRKKMASSFISMDYFYK